MEAVEAPAIETVPAWDAAELAAIQHQLREGAFDWVVLSSQNAAFGVQQELVSARVLCGAATARILGLAPEIALRHFSATTALEALRPVVRPGERLLVPRAAAGRDELLSGLRALGVEVSAPEA
jgi:uroporphyrinogen-III synthase